MNMNQDLLANLSRYLLLSPYPPCIGFPSLRPSVPCAFAFIPIRERNSGAQYLVAYVRPARIAEGEENRMSSLVSQGSLSRHVTNHSQIFPLGLGAEASIDEEDGVQPSFPAVERLSLGFNTESVRSDLMRVAVYGGVEADEIALGFLPLAVGIGGRSGNKR